MTLPNGIPNEMTSASDTSMGTLRTWRTREGAQGDRSPLYGLLSLPLAAKKSKQTKNNYSLDITKALLTVKGSLLENLSQH